MFLMVGLYVTYTVTLRLLFSFWFICIVRQEVGNYNEVKFLLDWSVESQLRHALEVILRCEALKILGKKPR